MSLKGFGLYEDSELFMIIFQGTKSDAQKMCDGFKRAPLNKNLNLHVKEIEIEVIKEL